MFKYAEYTSIFEQPLLVLYDVNVKHIDYRIQIIIINMSWYGNYNQSAKQLDTLLDSRPNLATLLLYPDFIQQLKSFNPKLLDYISNSTTLPSQIVTYLTVAPVQADSVDRKYKLPLLTVQMVETETICIMNALLKQKIQNINYFLTMFQMLKQPPILPLLAGYFNRTCYILSRTRYKQCLQSVYSSSSYLQLLVNNASNQSISSCLPLYLCVQSSKNIILPQQKTAIKINAVRTIMTKIQSQKGLNDQDSYNTVQNLCVVLRDIVDKYYLISNGKQMLQIILQDKYVQMMINMIGDQNQNSFPAMHLVLSYLKYYSLSAFNSQQGGQQISKKNMQRLQSQPFIKIMNSSFKTMLQKVKRRKTLDLYCYVLLQVLCHCITLSSVKLLNTIKQCELFPTLIDLLFKNQNCNILHKLVQRVFLHTFTTQKNIYEKYKQYLFCQISVIDLTAKRLLQLFPEPDVLDKAKSRGYFGILIKIIKIYSSISTTNTQIKQAITSKSQVWSKITKKIIKPYEANTKQEIGQLVDVPQNAPIQFTVKRLQNQLIVRLVQNNDAVQQIRKQEETMTKNLQPSQIKKQSQTLSQAKTQDQTFFKTPLEDQTNKKKLQDFSTTIKTQSTLKSYFKTADQTSQQQKNALSRPSNFSDFMNKRKVEVGQQIKMQRSISGQKKLSADRATRLASPTAGRKKNSWKQQGDQDKKQKNQHKIPVIKDIPKIPISHTHNKPTPAVSPQVVKNDLSKSTFQQPKRTVQDENKRMLSLSMANLQTLKKTTIIRTTQQPAQKKYRKAKSKDKAIFAYLGINC